MLHISQMEKPRCSATIEKIRLRRAVVLPVDSQKFSSSGCQSDIQASRLAMRDVLFVGSFMSGSAGQAVDERRLRLVRYPRGTEPLRWAALGPRLLAQAE